MGGYKHAAVFPGMVLWVYYLDDKYQIPAPTLEVSFDQRGMLLGYDFIDPASGAHLSLRQTLADADRERKATCDETPRIVFDEVLKAGVSSEADVREALGEPNRAGASTAAPTIWSYFVRKPSPLRLLAVHMDIDFGDPQFDANGELAGVTDTDRVRFWSLNGSHGCPVL